MCLWAINEARALAKDPQMSEVVVKARAGQSRTKFMTQQISCRSVGLAPWLCREQ